MSLLFNLLAFSSLNSSGQKEPRSASLGSKFFFQEETPKARDRIQKQQKRTESKSLTKMNLFSNSNTKIDPKQRCLHKIVHRLGIKVRKHYYSLFVILQTMKKNDTCLNGSEKKNENKENISNGCNKLQQIIKILVSKQFEQKWKSECFKNIQQFSEAKKQAPLVNKFQNSFNKIIKRVYFHKFIKSLKDLEAEQLKVDIFVETLGTFFIKKTNQIFSPFKKQSFELLKLYFNEGIKQTFDQTSVSQCYQEKIETRTQNLCEKQVITDKSQIYQDQADQFPPMKRNTRIKSQNDSPIRVACKLITLKKAVHKDNIDGICENISKTYNYQTNLDQKPIQFSEKYQALPKIVSKQLPQQLGAEEIGDLQDISRIFRQQKTNKQKKQKISRNDKISIVSGIQYEEFSDAVSESFLRIENMINDMEKHRDKSNKPSRQQLNFNNFSISSEMIEDDNVGKKRFKQGDSLFSSDAVSFKNSLVYQRQSMNKMDRERISFLKKKSNGPQKKRNQKNAEKQERDSKKQMNKTLRKNLTRRVSFQEEYLFEDTILSKKRNTQFCAIPHDKFSNEVEKPKCEQIQTTPYHNRGLYCSADKSKQFTFKPQNIEISKHNLIRKQKQVQDFDQKSDEGVKYIFGNHEKHNWTSFDSMFQNNYSSDNKYFTYSSDKQIPVKDISLNQKMDLISKGQFSFDKTLGAKTSKNKTSPYHYYQIESKKDNYVTPKKFINLIRK